MQLREGAMLATLIVVGVCLAGSAFCLRFLFALQRECQRSLICYVMRLETEPGEFVPAKSPRSLRARAHAA